jgi:hypothetical protein
MRIAHLAEAIFNFAGRASSVHHGTFDGWCWSQVQHASAAVADWLDPIPPR